MIALKMAIFLAALCSISAACIVYLLRDRGGALRPRLSELGETDVVFLFRKGRLVDATVAARMQMPVEPERADDLARFVITFGQRFEGLADRLSQADEDTRFEIAEVPDDPDSLRLVVERSGDLIRVSLTDPLRGTRSETLAHYSLAAMRAELFTLRSIAERSPVPTWKRRHDGSIIWANGKYMGLAREVAGEEALIGWPPPDVFDTPLPVGEASAAQASDAPRRMSVIVAGRDQPLWFDVLGLPGEIETLFFAMPIDKLVRAENTLTEFVQTLTKTFADLKVGLAIFDRTRKLVLFNPALIDLTGLPPEQLSSRPTLHAFLDALRDLQRIPEPKDYKSWRMQIAQVEAGAADGTFEETWHLPTGQTFRVSGRPHPDGAVAYLFEDISSEVSKTRSFRSEIELSQSVLDGLDTAVAAFSRAGFLTMSNRAYRDLWQTGGMTSLTETSIDQAAQHWHTHVHSDEALDRIRKAVVQKGDRSGWSGLIEMADGTVLRGSVRPIAGGASLVTFDRVVKGGAVLPANGDDGSTDRTLSAG